MDEHWGLPNSMLLGVAGKGKQPHNMSEDVPQMHRFVQPVSFLIAHK